jgi:hypothetical protein
MKNAGQGFVFTATGTGRTAGFAYMQPISSAECHSPATSAR